VLRRLCISILMLVALPAAAEQRIIQSGLTKPFPAIGDTGLVSIVAQMTPDVALALATQLTHAGLAARARGFRPND
jgi:hypothetical protein